MFQIRSWIPNTSCDTDKESTMLTLLTSMRKLRQERWSDFSKTMELASCRSETSNSQMQNLHSLCAAACLLKAAPCGPLVCYSGRVNTWRRPFARRACWVDYQVKVRLHFWRQKAAELVGAPLSSVGPDGRSGCLKEITSSYGYRLSRYHQQTPFSID